MSCLARSPEQEADHNPDLAQWFMEALIEQLVDYILATTNASSQITFEDTSFYHQLLGSCIDSCLIQPPEQLRKKGCLFQQFLFQNPALFIFAYLGRTSLSEQESKAAKLAINLLDLAVKRLPSVFTWRNSGNGVDSNVTAAQNLAGSGVLSQMCLATGNEKRAESEFLPSVLVSIFKCFAHTALRELHTHLHGLLVNILLLLKDVSRDSPWNFLQTVNELIDLHEDLHACPPPDQLYLFKKLFYVPTLGALSMEKVAGNILTLADADQKTEFLQNLYSVFEQILEVPFFIVDTFGYRLLQMLTRKLKNCKAVNDLERCLRLLAQLLHRTILIPLSFKQSLANMLMILLHQFLQKDYGRGDTKAELESTFLDCWKNCVSIVPVNSLIGLRNSARQLLSLHVFRRIDSITFKNEILLTYANILKVSKRLDLDLMQNFIELSSEVGIRDSVAACVLAALPPAADPRAKVPVTSGKRKHVHYADPKEKADERNETPMNKRLKGLLSAVSTSSDLSLSTNGSDIRQSLQDAFQGFAYIIGSDTEVNGKTEHMGSGVLFLVEKVATFADPDSVVNAAEKIAETALRHLTDLATEVLSDERPLHGEVLHWFTIGCQAADILGMHGNRVSSTGISQLLVILSLPWIQYTEDLSKKEQFSYPADAKSRFNELQQSMFPLGFPPLPSHFQCLMSDDIKGFCLSSWAKAINHVSSRALEGWLSFIILESMSMASNNAFILDSAAATAISFAKALIGGNQVAGLLEFVHFISTATEQPSLKFQRHFIFALVNMIEQSIADQSKHLDASFRQFLTYQTWSGLLLPSFPKLNATAIHLCAIIAKLVEVCPLMELGPQNAELWAWVIQGLSNEDGAIRLACGEILHRVFGRLSQNPAFESTLHECEKDLFLVMKRFGKESNLSHLETFLKSLGKIGVVLNDEFLVKIVFFLVDQLGHAQMTIRTLSSAQLQLFAVQHNKSLVNFFEPFQSALSLYLIDRVETEPRIYRTYLQMMGIANFDFLNKNSKYILPFLVVRRDAAKIEEISKVLKLPVPNLLVEAGDSILARILLQGREYEKTMNFYLSMIPNTTGISGLLRCFASSLVTTLAIELGESEHAKERAKSALQVMQAIREEASFQNDNVSLIVKQGQSLSRFLHMHIFSLLEHANQTIVDTEEVRSIKEKIRVVNALREIVVIIGRDIKSVLPQITATLQTAMKFHFLRTAVIGTWRALLDTLQISDIANLLNSICAMLTQDYTELTETQLSMVVGLLKNLLVDKKEDLSDVLPSVLLLPDAPAFHELNAYLSTGRDSSTFLSLLGNLLPSVAHENAIVALRGLHALRKLLLVHEQDLHEVLLAETIDDLVSRTILVLLEAIKRFNSSSLEIQVLCTECLGSLGANDPFRLDIPSNVEKLRASAIDLSNLEDAINLSCVLIATRLAPACRSTIDTKLQSNYAYAIQELLKFAGFTEEIITTTAQVNKDATTLEAFLRRKWLRFPADVKTAVAPFLTTKYSQTLRNVSVQHAYPLFPQETDFQSWLQTWTGDLIRRTIGKNAQAIFSVCKNVVMIGDINVAQFILPHLILNVLIAGDSVQQDEVYLEIMAVLEADGEDSKSGTEKRQLGAQLIFSLMDHLSQWVHIRRQDDARKRIALARKQNRYLNVEESVPEKNPSITEVEDFLIKIPQKSLAESSLSCRAYARALLHYEQHIRHVQSTQPEKALQPLYAQLQQIYAHLDEQDGLEGVSKKFVAPTLDQQILEHQSAGRWTAAQTCFEMLLQQAPEKLEHHIGLINCLKNLGHYETLHSHVMATAQNFPSWAPILNSYGIEAAWRMGDWKLLDTALAKVAESRFETGLGHILQAGRQKNTTHFDKLMLDTRKGLTAELVAASMESYRRGYDCVVKLHMLHEIEQFFRNPGQVSVDSSQMLNYDYFGSWDSRLRITLPSARIREAILSVRRILLSTKSVKDIDISTGTVQNQLGKLWLQSAKISRKAGHIQTAYSALLHASKFKAPEVQLERARWLWTQKETHKAMFELRSAIRTIDQTIPGDVAKNTTDTRDDVVFTRAKARLLLTRWMEETSTATVMVMLHEYQDVNKDVPEWEKGAFYLGRYFNKLYQTDEQRNKENLRQGISRPTNHTQLASLAHSICHQYSKALAYGAKYIYQTMPRLLTIWLSVGQKVANFTSENDDGYEVWTTKFNQMNRLLKRMNERLPAYQFLTSIPQLASRIGHANRDIHQILEAILVNVLSVYPQQTLWQLMAVAESSSPVRKQRMRAIFSKVKSDPAMRHLSQGGLHELIQEAQALTKNLLDLCNFPVQPRDTTMSISKNFRNLARMTPLRMIVPLQSTMTAVLPLGKQVAPAHRPFPHEAPTISGFNDEVDVMNSLQRPRKLTIRGSNGRNYIFLCKPKDDLRKDCRLMEFNSMINKMLKKDPSTRRRRLYIRTYAVIPLNEECGLIEWVPNTVGFRHIMVAAYKSKNIYCTPMEVKQMMDRKQPGPEEIFTQMILPKFPPVFHEWFLETFTEPTRWLASRQAYSSTTAVMSMVGYVVGLGDRHGENILFDDQTGDCVHVDLNCLFEKGLTFEKPERVPFRLTHNMVGAFGVTGTEGIFRKCCEMTLAVLRANRDSLMSVLETFLYDPLCEWNRPSRRAAHQNVQQPGFNSATTDADGENRQARETLDKIDRKLQGFMGDPKELTLPFSVQGQVHELIEQATSTKNLSLMYIGWTAYI
ncbi:hypothetical protein DFS34DRAFT_36356 [Phlyctochytrium arcticum]|nr:hypothetical protein DFS34DRAFT_36356 [Phlyctochytrium arcticum]